MAHRSSVDLARLGAAVVAAIVVAACAAPTAVSSPSPTAERTASTTPSASPFPTPTPTPAPTTPRTGNADFFFQPGAMRWCGVFVSYRAGSSTQLGDLRIGAVTFRPATEGFGAPYSQLVASDVRPGDWVCLSGTIARSDTVPGVLTNFSLENASVGTMPPTPVLASPCGLITEVFVDDPPSGGFVTLNGTKFLVQGARAVQADLVQLTSSELKVGVRVCINDSRLRPIDPATFEALGGRVTVMR